MSELGELVNELQVLESGYTPNPELMEPLRDVSLVAVYGPSCVGKTALINGVVRIDPDTFGHVRTSTTRPEEPRDVHASYRFVPHNAAQLELIKSQVKHGALTQYSVSPHEGHVYYATPASYPKPYSLLDALPQTHRQMVRLPFEEFREVAVVSPAALWHKRFVERYADRNVRVVGQRLQEGADNLQWCLEQDGIIWVVNTGNQVVPVAHNLRAAILDPGKSNRSGRIFAGRLLQHITGLLDS